MGKTKIFACRTVEDEILAVLPPHIDYEFLEYALHNTPDKLRDQLQKRVDEATGYETLLFGYGLCSNGVAGLCSKKHTLVVPKIHDCISLLLGSRKQYNIEFENFPATYYLSRGWIKQKGDPLSSYQENSNKYGEANAHWLLEQEYGNYQRVVFIHTLHDAEEEEHVQYSREVARLLKVDYVEMNGSLNLFKNLVNGDWERGFVITPPGQIVMQRAFM